MQKSRYNKVQYTVIVNKEILNADRQISTLGEQFFLGEQVNQNLLYRGSNCRYLGLVVQNAR